MCLSVVCTCVCVCVCVFVCVRAWVRASVHVSRYVLVPCADAVSRPSGLDPLPLTKILDPRMGPSIHPLKIVKLSIKEISVFGRSVN